MIKLNTIILVMVSFIMGTYWAEHIFMPTEHSFDFAIIFTWIWITTLETHRLKEERHELEL